MDFWYKEFSGQSFSLIFLEREVGAHKSKLIMPPFKILQRVPPCLLEQANSLASMKPQVPPFLLPGTPLPMAWFFLPLPCPMMKWRACQTWEGALVQGFGDWTSFLVMCSSVIIHHTHLFSHNFCESGVNWAQLSWVLCSGSHKGVIEVAARTGFSSGGSVGEVSASHCSSVLAAFISLRPQDVWQLACSKPVTERL